MCFDSRCVGRGHINENAAACQALRLFLPLDYRDQLHRTRVAPNLTLCFQLDASWMDGGITQSTLISKVSYTALVEDVFGKQES